MQQADIITRMPEIFEEVFEYEGPLSAATTAEDVEEWDSLGHIRLMLAVEQAFGIRFQPKKSWRARRFGIAKGRLRPINHARAAAQPDQALAGLPRLHPR
jgi:acyl carrier protein